MVDPVAPKLLAGPAAPTDEERRIHEATHLPPQPWCEWCVLGRGAATQHAKKQDIHSIPVIAMDFGFLKAEAEDGTAASEMETSLVVVDTATRMLKVIPTDSKGRSD